MHTLTKVPIDQQFHCILMNIPTLYLHDLSGSAMIQEKATIAICRGSIVRKYLGRRCPWAFSGACGAPPARASRTRARLRRARRKASPGCMVIPADCQNVTFSNRLRWELLFRCFGFTLLVQRNQSFERHRCQAEGRDPWRPHNCDHG